MEDPLCICADNAYVNSVGRIRFPTSRREYFKDHGIRLITNESMKDKTSLS